MKLPPRIGRQSTRRNGYGLLRGVLAHPDTPAENLEWLEEMILTSGEGSAYQERIETLGLAYTPMTHDEMVDYLMETYETLDPIIREPGARRGVALRSRVANNQGGLLSMEARAFTYLVPVTAWAESVEFWTAVLGCAPAVDDGESWAQFKSEHGRVALVAGDASVTAPCLAVRVSDDEDLTSLIPRHFQRGLTDGGHERRLLCADPDGHPVIIYQPKMP